MIETLFGLDDRGEVAVLTGRELEELHSLVDTIYTHQRDYRRIGEALTLIETRGLYRGYGSFDRFIEQVLGAQFGLERAHCFRLIKAYEVALDLSPIGDRLPENEAQCRELAVLKTPEARQRAWKEALAFAGAGPVTAEMVRGIVRPMVTVARSTHAPSAPLPVGTAYGVILADPPWQYEANSTNRERRIEEHYPTMTLADIKALPVRALSGRECVLFLWTTAPKLLEAGEVIAAWGFNYRTNLIWDKGGMGLGHYIRVNHEHLMIAVKGKPGTPATAVRPLSPVRAAKLRHSEKPVVFHEMIEAMYPGRPRIELFARRRREGWDAWGNEVE